MNILNSVRKLCTVTGAIVLAIIVLGIIVRIASPGPQLADDIVLTLNVDEALGGNGPAQGLLSQLLPPENPTLGIVRAIDRARHDGRVRGLVARFGNGEPGLAQAQEIRDALRRFKDSGKFTIAFAPSFGELTPATRAYYLASTFAEVWVQPGGLVGLNGIAFETPFWRGTLEKFGLRPEYIQRSGYKTAMASLHDGGFTPQHRAMMTGLLADINAQLAAGIAENRNLSLPAVQKILGTGPLPAAEALRHRLVDKIGYEDEALDALKQKAGDKTHAVTLADYWSVAAGETPRNVAKPDPNKAVAVIEIAGVIHDGDSVRLPGRTSAGAATIAAALETALKDAAVKAVILRIDSPGGSAVASETIHRAITKVAAQKPVIASMATAAASGGYWIATAAHYIVAQPATLTGSIGVVAGKISGGDLLRQNGAAWGQIAEGDGATLWSLGSPFTPTQRAKLERLADAVYATFKQRVMQGRGIDAATAESVAQGHVWTGRQALDRKLVDALGGMDTALAHVRGKIGLGAESPVAVMRLPAPPTPQQQLIEMLRFYQQHAAITVPAALDAIQQTLLPAGLVQAEMPDF